MRLKHFLLSILILILLVHSSVGNMTELEGQDHQHKEITTITALETELIQSSFLLL